MVKSPVKRIHQALDIATPKACQSDSGFVSFKVAIMVFEVDQVGRRTYKHAIVKTGNGNGPR